MTLGFLCPPGAAGNDLVSFSYPPFRNQAVKALLFMLPGRTGEQDHEIHNLLRIGNPAALETAARQMAIHKPLTALWASTSGSFVGGNEWSNRQVAALERAAGCSAGNTSLAFIDALKALNIASVAVVATYTPDIADRFAAFLEKDNVRVRNVISIGLQSRRTASRISGKKLIAAAAQADVKDAGAVLLPGISMNTLRLIHKMESQLGKPVLTSSQVLIWQALRLVGLKADSEKYGRLLSRQPDEAYR